LLCGSRNYVSPRNAGLTAMVGNWIYAVSVGADTAVAQAAIMAGLLIVFAALPFSAAEDIPLIDTLRVATAANPNR
jgi:hypothetical protein